VNAILSDESRLALCYPRAAMQHTSLVLLLLLLGATACPSPARAPTVGNTTDTPGAPARQLTADGLGGLTASTPITVETVQPLFPDLEVTTDTVEREDGNHTFLRAAKKGAATPDFLLYFGDDRKLYSLEVWTPEIRTATGAAVGQSFTDAAAALGGVTCFGAVEEEGGNAYCWSTTTKSLALLVPLNDETSKYYDHEVPVADYPTAFANQKVERIVWGPGRE
jgi:hypothetical protein